MRLSMAFNYSGYPLSGEWVKLRRAFQYLWDHNDLETGEYECKQTRYATKHGKPDYSDNRGVDERNSVMKHRLFEYRGHQFIL